MLVNFIHSLLSISSNNGHFFLSWVFSPFLSLPLIFLTLSFPYSHYAGTLYRMTVSLFFQCPSFLQSAQTKIESSCKAHVFLYSFTTRIQPPRPPSTFHFPISTSPSQLISRINGLLVATSSHDSIPLLIWKLAVLRRSINNGYDTDFKFWHNANHFRNGQANYITPPPASDQLVFTLSTPPLTHTPPKYEQQS